MKSLTLLSSAESVFFVNFLVGCRLVVLSGDRIHTDAGQSLFAVLASAQFLDLLLVCCMCSGRLGVECLSGTSVALLDCL